MQGLSLSTAMKGFRDTPVKDSLVYVTFHTPLFWFYFLFIFPLITMRLFAEEERAGTLETLLTAPVRTWQVVLSKYAAAMIFYTVLWLPGPGAVQDVRMGHRPAAGLDSGRARRGLLRHHAHGRGLHRRRLPGLRHHLQPDHRRH